MSEKYGNHNVVLVGPHSFNGQIEISGDKVASVHVLYAAIFSLKPIVFCNLNLCLDVKKIIKNMQDEGWAKFDFVDDKIVCYPQKINDDISKLSFSRASICMATAVGMKMGKVKVACVGGCSFTDRPIDKHIYVLNTFGFFAKLNNELYIKDSKKNKKLSYVVDCSVEKYGPSVGATCHALIAAMTLESDVELINVALEPACMIVAEIVKNGSNKILKINKTNRTITILKNEVLIDSKNNIEIIIPSDLTEMMTYVTGSILHRDKVCLKNIYIIDSILSLLDLIGVNIEWKSKNCAIFDCSNASGSKVKDIHLDVWPSIPSDMGPIISVALIGLNGCQNVIEHVYDKRSSHVEELIKMGFNISALNNIVTVSDDKLFVYDGIINVEAKDIRSGVAVLLAATTLNNKVVIHNFYQIQRGYEDIVNKLLAVGVNIYYE